MTRLADLVRERGRELDPTSEQSDIILHEPVKGDVVAVKAFAGTGKTSTLVMFAREHMDKDILYLAYNRAMREDAGKKFPPNVLCRTTHQMCFRAFGKRYADNNKLGDPRKLQMAGKLPDRFVSDYYSKWHNVRAVEHTLKNFIYSADFEIKKKHIPHWVKDKHDKLSVGNSDIVEGASIIWNCMKNRFDYEIPMPHDGYLKEYQLSKPRIATDLILFDEFQDTNPATLDIILRQADHAALVCVGDPYQQMYSFRGSVNAFDRVPATKSYALTKSFRFGDDVAELATGFLKKHYAEDSEIKGNGSNTEVVFKDTKSIDGMLDKTVIARTNGKLLSIAFEAVEEGYDVGFCGGLNKNIFWTLKAINDLRQGNTVKHEFISLFDSMEDLHRYASDARDHEILWYLKLFFTYGSSVLPRLKTVEQSEVPFGKADINLITAHKSKGLEFPEVLITQDFIPAEDMESGDVRWDPEDVNVLYVAMTRGTREVSLAESIEDHVKKGVKNG